MKKIPRLAVRPDLAYRLFYPVVPPILCAKSSEISSMPVASAVPISNSPARIAVAVKKELKTNFVLKSASTYSLNWVGFNKRDFITRLSEVRKNKGRNKLKALKIEYFTVLEAPVLEESLAYVILKKERTMDVGDHDLFIGRVMGGMAILDFDEYWKFEEYKPILYRGSELKRKLATL